MAGLEKKQSTDVKTNRIVAVHESGHAVCSWFLEGGDPLLKVTEERRRRKIHMTEGATY